MDEESTQVIDLDELNNFFDSILSSFTPSIEGDRLISIFQGNWEFFTDEKAGEKILQNVCQDLGKEGLLEGASLSSYILEDLSFWKDYKTNLIQNHRFINDAEVFIEQGWDRYLNWTSIVITKDHELYRARRHSNYREKAYNPEEICPVKIDQEAYSSSTSKSRRHILPVCVF